MKFPLFAVLLAAVQGFSWPPNLPKIPVDHMQKGLEECQQALDKIHTDGGYFVVKAISAGLPYVDSIGHRILHANDVFINQVLNTEGMPHEIKAKIILTAIQVSQAGDNFGGVLLKLYYDIVERCFH